MLQGWLRITRAVNSDPIVSNRVFYDVLNEPDAFGVRFEPANGRPGMKDLYFLAFDAIYSVNPGAPVFACPAPYPTCSASRNSSAAPAPIKSPVAPAGNTICEQRHIVSCPCILQDRCS
jgi:hypothetical protein